MFSKQKFLFFSFLQLSLSSLVFQRSLLGKQYIPNFPPPAVFAISETLNICSKCLGLGNESGRTHRLVTSFLLCLGGGVLMATAMLHILPEISEELAGAGERLGIEFLPHLVLCSGFFLIYLVEELAETLLGGHHETETLHRTMSVRRSSRKEDRVTVTPSYGAINKGADLSQSSSSVDMESPDLLVSKTKENSSSLREFFTSKLLIHPNLAR